jgi:hypothetical protein
MAGQTGQRANLYVYMSTGKSTACSAAISSDGLKGFKDFDSESLDLVFLFSVSAVSDFED